MFSRIGEFELSQSLRVSTAVLQELSCRLMWLKVIRLKATKSLH